jgi:virginiamycin B lyase
VAITAGPEKDLWFTDDGTSKIGKITTSGTITEYALPSGSHAYRIAAGPDDNLWFTELGTTFPEAGQTSALPKCTNV